MIWKNFGALDIQFEGKEEGCWKSEVDSAGFDEDYCIGVLRKSKL